MDNRLFCVRSTIKRLQKELDDAYWEGNVPPDVVDRMERELCRLVKLSEEGVTVGANF